mgnify:CR=1 FL=1
MSALSKSIADSLMNHLLRAIDHTAPANVYLALHDSGGGVAADPGDQATAAFANELAFTSYERKIITFGAPTGTDNSVVANDVAIVFPRVDAGEGPVDVTGMSLWTAQKGIDAGSSGVMLFQYAVSTVKTFADNDAPTVDIGEIVLTLD